MHWAWILPLANWSIRRDVWRRRRPLKHPAQQLARLVDSVL
jgi:hypothetical protein